MYNFQEMFEKKITMSKKVIGILVAMDKEYELLSNLLDSPMIEYKKVGPNHRIEFIYSELNPSSYNTTIVVVCKTGIGKVNAAMTATLLEEFCKPDIIISTGVCGSLLTEGVNQGDIVIGKTVHYHDVWCGKPNNNGQVQGLPTIYESVLATDELYSNLSQKFSNKHFIMGDIISGDWFVDTKEKATSVVDTFGETAGLDMESAALAQVCHLYGTKFMSIRIVSDCPMNEQSAQYADFWTNAPKDLVHVVNEVINFV